jgi:hypothetical protein
MLIRSIGLSELRRKHITSPLRVQLVNAIYRFDVSETELCLHLQVEPTQFCPRDGASLYLRSGILRRFQKSGNTGSNSRVINV